MFTSFFLTRNADGIESARLWSILPVSNNIAELPGLGLGLRITLRIFINLLRSIFIPKYLLQNNRFMLNKFVSN